MNAAGGQSLRLLAPFTSKRLSFAAQVENGAIFDGWIYNRDSLLAELSAPTEAANAALALSAYLRWGEEALHKIKGIFAFCIWDGRSRSLFCARDPVGVYPLFYARTDREWLFSTSVDSLLEHPDVPRTINRGALASYLWWKWQYFDIGETYYSNIGRVPPGHVFKVRGIDSNVTIYRYWDPTPVVPINWTRETELEQFPEVMKQAIGRCLQLGRAGIYLSGGLDSGTLATLATDLTREKLLPPPHAVSLIYPDLEADEEYSQRGIATSLGIPQTLVRHERADDTDDLFLTSLKLNDTWPHPLVVGLSPLHLTLGDRAWEQGCDFVLSGEGGDEWLDIHYELAADFIRALDISSLLDLSRIVRSGGRHTWYGTAKSVLWFNGFRRILFEGVESTLRKTAPDLSRARFDRSVLTAIPDWLSPDPELRKNLCKRAEKSAEDTNVSFYQRGIFAQILNHPLTLWYKEDNFESSRRTGVLMLEPFYDPDVIEFLVRIPPWLRSRGGRRKGLLRHFLHQRFSHLGYDRQQKPFANNFNAVRTLGGAKRLWPMLKGTRALAELGVVDTPRMDGLISQIIEQRQLHQRRRLWMTLCAEVWLRARLHGVSPSQCRADWTRF